MNPVVLEDGKVKAVFNAENGSLVEFRDKVSGWNIISNPEYGLSFRLLVPIPGRRNNPVEGASQKPPTIRVQADGRGLEMDWEKVESLHGGELDISFHASVILDGGKLTFKAKVVNRSQHTLEYACFPCLGEVSLPPGEEEMGCLAAGSYMGRIPLIPRFAGRNDYFGWDNPTQMVGTPDTPFVLLASKGKGLYAGCHETKVNELVQFVFTVKPGVDYGDGWGCGEFTPGDGRARLDFSMCSFVFAGPGETREISPLVLAPYSGTWHKGADIYKEWRESWFKRPPEPDWAADIHSWFQYGINSPEDELRCQYSDLVEFGKDCAKHGVKAFHLIGWNDGGQDRNNPSHDTDPRLGTADDLKQAIKEIQDMGVKVILFNKFTWSDRHTERFRTSLIKQAVKDPYGDYYVYPGYQYQTMTQLSDINTRRLVAMCMQSAEWRREADAEFTKSLDLGADGMVYDEAQHHGNARYCFDASHGHRVPGFVFAGDEALAQGFRKIAGKRNPEYLFAGEALYEQEFRNYSISYIRISNPAHYPVQRYLDPQAGILVTIAGFNDRNVINQCLLYRYILCYEPLNFKGKLDDFPKTIEYGKKVDAFRRKFRRFLWDGEFRGTQGARVMAGGKPHEWYSVYLDAKTGKRAVALANYTAKEAEFIIEMDGGEVALVMATPETPELAKCVGGTRLAPYSSAVLMEE
jgi:hypothetical protein